MNITGHFYTKGRQTFKLTFKEFLGEGTWASHSYYFNADSDDQAVDIQEQILGRYKGKVIADFHLDICNI